MADPVKPFSPFFLQKFPGANRDEIIDRNLLAIKQAIEQANVTITKNTTDITRIINGDVTINITTLPGPPGPPGIDAADADGGGDFMTIPGPPGRPGRDGVTVFMPDAAEDQADVFTPPSPGSFPARVWLSTPSPVFPSGVNMGALAQGVVQQSVTAGVATPNVFTATVSRIPFGSGTAGGLTDSSLVTWDGTRVAFGTAAPLAQSVGHFYRQNDGQADLIVANDSTGTAAQMAVRLTRGAGGSTDSLLFALLGTNFAGGGFVVAKSALFELEDAGNFIYSVYGAGDHVWATTTGRTERMRITNGGELSIAINATQAWYNSGSASGSYERIRAIWVANVWSLLSESSGGTVRSITIDAGTGTATVNGANAVLSSGTMSLAVSSVVANFALVTTRASSASATLDALNVAGSTIQVTGGTNITTAAGFNYATFNAPTYSGGGVAKTITNAATVTIMGAPAGASSATITNAFAFWVQAGKTKLDGDAQVGGVSKNVGFYGNPGVAQPTVTGSRGGNAALLSLLTALSSQSLVVDSTSP